MVEIQVSTSDFDAAMRRLRFFEGRNRKNTMVGAMRAAVAVVRNDLRSRLPVRTGVLRKSVRTSVRSNADGSDVIGRVKYGGKKAFHANILEGGRRGVGIVKPNRAARFKRGRPVGARLAIRLADGSFRAYTRHVGIPARRYAEHARLATRQAARAAFTRYVVERVRRQWNQSAP